MTSTYVGDGLAGWRPASNGSRLASYAIDVALLLASGLVAWWIVPSPGLAAGVVAEFVLVFSVMRAASGRTPGGYFTHTAAIAAGTDHAPGMRSQGIRTLLIVLLHVTLVGPALSAMSAKYGRDWIDRIAGTAVVDTRMVPISTFSAPTEPVAVPAPYQEVQAAYPQEAGYTEDPVLYEVAPMPYPEEQLAYPDTQSGYGYDAQGQVVEYVTQTPVDSLSNPVPVPLPVSVPLPAATDGAAEAPSLEAEAPSLEQAVTPIVAEAWLVSASGNREPIGAGQVLVLGRAPLAQEECERAIAMDDPSRTLSRTHVRVGHDGLGVWVADEFSANGTVVTAPGEESREMNGGERRYVPDGTVVEIGDHALTVVYAQPVDAE